MNCINFTLRDFWIFILHIFSLQKEKFQFWKRLGPILRIWEEEERKKEREKCTFFINMNPFVNYSARRAVQKWTGWDRNTVRHSSLNEKWVEILSEVTISFHEIFTRYSSLIVGNRIRNILRQMQMNKVIQFKLSKKMIKIS